MEEQNNIPDWVRKTDKPSVPDGFFETFIKRLLKVIAASETENSTEFGAKMSKPSVPDGFFETFSDKLMAKIQSEEEAGVDLTEANTFMSQFKLREKPSVPVGYFDSFADTVQQKPAARGRIISLRVMMTITSAAAIFLLFMLVYNPNNNPSTLEGTDVTAQNETENYDEYLAYLDEDEIIDYIIENDVELDGYEASEEEEALYDIVGDDIEELYLDF